LALALQSPEKPGVGMRTINTLARHRAALLEARRLTALVLANNPSFAALLALDADKTGEQTAARAALESDLASDPVYGAWLQLGKSLGGHPEPELSCFIKDVALIVSEASQQQSLSEAQTTTPLALIKPNSACSPVLVQEGDHGLPHYGASFLDAVNQHADEATVSIVYRDCNVHAVSSVILASAKTGQLAFSKP
jgi:hypothetical protein